MSGGFPFILGGGGLQGAHLFQHLFGGAAAQSNNNQQQPTLFPRGVGHIYMGDQHPREWIDLEQHHRASDPPASPYQQQIVFGPNGPQLQITRRSRNPQQQQAPAAPLTASELREHGNEAYRAGNYAQALALYTEALTQNPEDELAFTNRAQAYIKLHDYDSAAADARRAIAIAPKGFKGHYRLGVALSLAGYHTAALASLNTALSLVPSDNQTLIEEITVMKKKTESRIATATAAAAASAAANEQLRRATTTAAPLASSSTDGSSNMLVMLSPTAKTSTFLATPQSSSPGVTLFPGLETALAALKGGGSQSGDSFQAAGAAGVAPSSFSLPANIGNGSGRSGGAPPTTPVVVVALDRVADLISEAKKWRGVECKTDAFVSNELVDTLGRLCAKELNEAEQACRKEVNPEILMDKIEQLEKCNAALAVAAKGTDRTAFHSALSARDEAMQAALKAASRSRANLARMRELQHYHEQLRARLDEQLHTCCISTSSSSGSARETEDDDAMSTISSATSESASGSATPSGPKKTGTAAAAAAASSFEESSPEAISRLLEEFRTMRSEIDDDVRAAVARTDAAAAAFVNVLKEERRLLMSSSEVSKTYSNSYSDSSGDGQQQKQQSGADAASNVSTRLRPLRDISARIVAAAKSKLSRRSSGGSSHRGASTSSGAGGNFIISQEQAEAVESLARRVEADRQQLANARAEGAKLLDAESVLERDRLSLEKQRIQLAAELEWIKVKDDGEEGDAKKIESLTRHIERIKQRLAEILKRQKETQSRIMTLISTASPELAWKAATSGKVVRWAQGPIWAQTANDNSCGGGGGGNQLTANFAKISDYEISAAPISVTPSSRILSARKHRTGNRVVLKETLCETEEQMRRFKNEISVVCGLPPHRNVLKPNTFFLDSASGYAYQELPLYEGSILDFLRRGIPLSGWRLQDLLRQICSGVAHLHHHQTIHSDIKPQNLLLNWSSAFDRSPVISDFGIAKTSAFVGATTATATHTRGPRGSLPYMAPELESLMLMSQQQPSSNAASPTAAASGGAAAAAAAAASSANTTTNNSNTTGSVINMKTDIFSLGVTLLQIAANLNKFQQQLREQQMQEQRDNQAHREEHSSNSNSSALDAAVAAAAAAAAAANTTTPTSSSSSAPGAENAASSPRTATATSSSSSSVSTPTTQKLLDLSEILVPTAAAGKVVDPAYVGNEKLADLITMMLSVEPANRPSIEQVLAHPYFSQSMTEESIKSPDLVESNKKIEALLAHIHALRTARRNPVLVSVVRDQMVESLHAIFAPGTLRDEALLNPLMIVFRGEEGIDDGGLLTDALVTYFRQAVTLHRLLVESNSESMCAATTTTTTTTTTSSSGGESLGASASAADASGSGGSHQAARAAAGAAMVASTGDVPYLPNEASDIPPPMFESMGRVILKSLIENRTVSVRLSSVVWKFLCGVTVPSMLDLEEYDRTLWRSLRAIQFYSPAELSAAGLSFSDFPDELLQDLDLLHLKDQDVLDQEAAASYIKAKVYEKLVFCRKTALLALRKGFLSCRELQSHLALTTPTELAIALCGQQSINFRDVVERLEFLGYPSDSLIPVQLVELIAHMSQLNLRRFVKFCTASVSLPHGRTRIKVLCTPDTSRLPVSHSCNFQLDLPNYENAKILAEKLATALEFSEEGGFFIV